MSALHIRPFQSADEEAVITLWQACGLVVPQNNPGRDIVRKLRVNPEWFLVAEFGNEIVGTCMAGYEGHRGWINYLAVRPDHQRHGLARELMQHAEGLLRAAGCPKINLQVRSTNTAVLAFYESIGFTVDDVVSLGKRLEHDTPPHHP
jgi:ribosomal protein S18 acetylase RimI-like enzyme